MHVLLVEDNDGDADLVSEAFGEIAHSEVEISRAVRMSVAIERLAARRFDAVLLDLSLPDAAGLDALVQMRTAAPTVPIVVLTGLANAAVGMKAIQHGAQDYLQKGHVAGTELLRAIRYARERSQIVQRAHVLSAVSAAIVGSRDPESVLAALDVTLRKEYVHWFKVDGASRAEPSVEDHLSAGDPPTQAAGQLFSSLQSVTSDLVPDYLTEPRSAGMCSAMVVPFQARGWAPGRLLFARSGEAEPFLAPDLLLGEEIARRTVAALEYAQLLALAQSERERAEVAGRARDEFLATLSHELRTPLNAILGWTVLLRDGKVDANRLPKVLETIERNARSQAALLEDIFEVSRIITGKIRLDFSLVDVSKVLTSAIESIAPAVQAKGLRVVVSGDAEVGSVFADADRLLQIFWNLLSNAVKFTPEGGQVSIQLTRRLDSVDVIVSDTGQGIVAELIPHIFQRFRQGDSTTTRAHSGLGLGLAIVRHLVELHGGTIVAESEGPGRGAKFSLRLAVSPRLRLAETLDQSPRKPVSAPPLRSDALPLAGISVLLVDDDEDARELLAAVFESNGAAVTSAMSASEGLTALRAHRPNILLSDIGMPGASGYDLIAQVRALGAAEGGATPAIALTAYARKEDRAHALSAGFDEHMSKPISAEKLIALVGGLTARPQRTE
jgi:signal transduction histidine kinase/DNA-binding response OmpR family regulator